MPKKILVIDDEELIVKSLTKLLEKNGFEVYGTKSSRDALVMAEEVDFDLIISDIRMPGLNGVEALGQIYRAKLKKKQRKIPVIFITGYSDGAVEAKAKMLMPSAYIYKPFDISELVGKVKKILAEA